MANFKGIVAALAVLATVAAGTAAPASAQQSTIRIFHFMGEQSKRDGLDKLIADFTKANPEVKIVVEATGFDGYTTALKTKIAAGDAPDLIFGRPKMFSELVAAGQILDLSGQPFLANVSASPLESMKIGGKVYGLPLDVQAMGVFYNKGIFDANGWKVPDSYPKLVALAKVMKAKGVTPFAFGFRDAWTAQVVYQSDLYGAPLSKMPSFFHDVGTRAKRFADFPEFTASLDRYAERLKYGNTDPFSVDSSRQLGMFATGKTAMVIQGSWAVGDIRKANPSGNFGFFLNPTSAKASDNLLDISVDDAFMVSAQTTNRAAVMKFLSFLASTEGASVWTETAKVISVAKGVKATNLDPMIGNVQSYISSGKTYNFEAGDVLAGQYDKTFRLVQEEFAAAPAEKRISADFAKRLDAEFDRIKATE